MNENKKVKQAQLIVFFQMIFMGLLVLAPFIENKALYWPQLNLIGIFGLLFILLGAYFLVSSLNAMGKNFKVLAPPKKEGELVKSWPFSFVRNPIYLAALFVGVGWSLVYFSLLTLLMTFFVYLILHHKMKLEEYFLKKQFGNEYEEYMKKTPRIFPKF